MRYPFAFGVSLFVLLTYFTKALCMRSLGGRRTSSKLS